MPSPGYLDHQRLDLRLAFDFPIGYAGEHVVEFIRMDIPSYARENNPDYDHLLDWYAEESLPIESVSFVVESSDIPNDVELRHTIVDPLSP